MILCDKCGIRILSVNGSCWLCGMCECDEHADVICEPHLNWQQLMTLT